MQSEIQQMGGAAHTFTCDVSNESEVNRVGKLVQQQVGDVTILVNNAGILQNLPFMELDSARIRKTFEINILAYFWVCNLHYIEFSIISYTEGNILIMKIVLLLYKIMDYYNRSIILNYV